MFLHMADEHGDWLTLKLNVLENRLLAQVELIWEHQVRINFAYQSTGCQFNNGTTLRSDAIRVKVSAKNCMRIT